MSDVSALSQSVQVLLDQLRAGDDSVRAELIAGFVPGVKLVPAHTLLVGLVQERGFTYQRV